MRAGTHELEHDPQQEPKPEAIAGVWQRCWWREDPLASYSPIREARARDAAEDAGAHVAFLNLARVLAEDPRKFERNLRLFVDRYGLLGLFAERHSAPILPPGKLLVAPNAAVSPRTRALNPIDPETQGIPKAEKLAHERRLERLRSLPEAGSLEAKRSRFEIGDEGGTALPEELTFRPKAPTPALPSGSLASDTIRWSDAEEEWGLFVLLDKHADFWASILSTREPIGEWERELRNFPLTFSEKAEERARQRAGREAPGILGLGNINAHLAGAVPYGYVGANGTQALGLWFGSLLGAMHFMVWLDLREGCRFPACRKPDCGRRFRAGPQSRAVYCSAGCAGAERNRAARRRNRP